MLNEALRGQLDKLRAAYDPNTAPGGITLWWGGSTFPDGEKDAPALQISIFFSYFIWLGICVDSGGFNVGEGSSFFEN